MNPQIGKNMTDTIISIAQLRRNNGDRGSRKWVAVDGTVYDVSDCPRWRNEMHEQLHFPGQDLSDEIQGSPHRSTVLDHDCVTVVGKLASGFGEKL